MMVLFESVLKVSGYTSVIILVFAVFSKIMRKRYSVNWRYFFWLILSLRLIFPIDITLPKPMIEIPVPQMQIESTTANSRGIEQSSFTNLTAPQVMDGELEIAAQPKATWKNSLKFFAVWNRLWIFWMLGMIVYFTFHGMKYFSFLKDLNRNSRRLRDAEVLESYYAVCAKMQLKKRPEIFICEMLSSPLCTGFFNQKIYLNDEGYHGDQLRYILKHELTHCKRRDVCYKALLLCAKGIHFFNPFVHWMVRMAERDMEYSCDAFVLEKCSLNQREAYGLTILESMGKGRQLNPLTTAFLSGKEELKLRIDHIFDVRKKKRGTLLLFILLLTVWMGMAFVGCGEKKETSQVDMETLDFAAVLYQCKMDYIGDHVGVGKILGNFTLPQGIGQSEEGIELFTSQEPYGVRRYLTLEEGQEIPQGGWFEKDAMLFLSLVDNASFFEYAITNAAGGEQILHFDRSDEANYFGDTDLRSMSADETTFRNFINELEQLFSVEPRDVSGRRKINGLLTELTNEMGETFTYEILRNNERYDALLKLGEDALTEIMLQFEQGQPDDIKGYIMMSACMELLNIRAASMPDLLKEMTPSQWYEAYRALDSMMMEPFFYDENRYTEKLEDTGLLPMQDATKEGLVTRHSDVTQAVYSAMEQRFSSENIGREVVIFAPLIRHISQSKEKLSVYGVIGVTRYSTLRIPNLGYQMVDVGGSHTPTRLDFVWQDGGWKLTNWVEAKDGSEYGPSIEEMCKEAKGVAKELISYDSREMQLLLMQNLIFYLNGRKDITVHSPSYMEEGDVQRIREYISFEQS